MAAPDRLRGDGASDEAARARDEDSHALVILVKSLGFEPRIYQQKATQGNLTGDTLVIIASRKEARPVLHHLSPLLQHVAAPVGALDVVAHLMRRAISRGAMISRSLESRAALKLGRRLWPVPRMLVSYAFQ